jgi:hypothetical protein
MPIPIIVVARSVPTTTVALKVNSLYVVGRDPNSRPSQAAYRRDDPDFCELHV